MKNSPKDTLNTVLFGIVAALAFVLVVTTLYSQNTTATIGSFLSKQDFGERITDVDIAEAEEAENATMAGATNQTTTNGNTTDVEFLSIQSAQSGSLSEINATAYSLELKNVSESTVLFSDRPNRTVETVSTSDFVSNWTAGPNSFASDAPNDVLIVENTQTGKLEIAVIESFTPVYDVNTNTLTYTITGENGTAVEIPNEFGQSVLVIDMAGEKITIYIKGNDVPIS